MSKIEIVTVYSHHPGEIKKMYENEYGIIYMSSKYHEGKYNIAYNHDNIVDINKVNSFIALEPFCTMAKNYDKEFIKKCKFIFTWTKRAYPQADNVIEFKHASIRFNQRFITDDNWQNRSDEIVFIANNKTSNHSSELYSLRLKLADALSEHYKVSWYGKMPINRKYYKGDVSHKSEVLRNVKFSICTENNYDQLYSHNYLSEKLPDVLLHGAVPIYMGCYNIDEFEFIKNTYIDLRKYCTNPSKGFDINVGGILSEINSFDYDNHKKNVENISDENIYSISFSQMYDKIIETYLNNS